MEKKCNFKLNQKALMLTYKGHIALDKFVFLQKKNTHKLIYEKGNTDYLHCHLIVMFDKPIRTNNPRYFDIGKIHCNIKPVKTKNHWLNCVDYDEADKKKGSAKFTVPSNTLTGNEYEWLGTVRTLIQEKTSWCDVINDTYLEKYIKKYLRWARECFDCKPTPNLSEHIKLRNWQHEEVKALENQNRRNVRWVYDLKGGVGKSVLADYLIDYKKAFFCDGGKLADIAYAYQNQEYVVFDLPRTSEDFTPYKAMECFKNGRLFSPKYTSCLKRFKPCKVIVFANYPPDRSKLSDDRWSINCIDPPEVDTTNQGPEVLGSSRVLNIMRDSLNNEKKNLAEIPKVFNFKKKNDKIIEKIS